MPDSNLHPATAGTMRSFYPCDRAALILAPMQDVTDLPFWRVMHRYGGPDIYFTEYFRVHPASTPEKKIIRCIRANPAGRPVIAQIIGQDLPALLRTAKFLQTLPVAAIDLNLGCPAPIVCRKSSGGGMLRDPVHLDRVLGELRAAITINFTIKTRIGFHEPGEFDALLDIYSRHAVDAVTVHGRTVKEMYRAPVHLDRIAQAVRTMPCPVIANGNVLGVASARHTLETTGAGGLMIGRGAIRNPWIWDQIRADAEGTSAPAPTLRDLLDYIHILWEETRPDGLADKYHVAKMKKYLNFIAQKIGGGDDFVQSIRRAAGVDAFFAVCEQYLDNDRLFLAELDEGALVNSGNPRENCY